MSDKMTHWERVRAALKGRETDRIAVSMWRHFYGSEAAPRSLAEAMLAFQKRFDWDFMKVNPRASYHAEGWDLRVRYDGDKKPVVTETPVKEPGDWLKLQPLPLDRGVLREHLEALELIDRGLDGQVPFLMTVFTPLSIAADLAPSEAIFLKHLREHTDNVRHALEVITETFIRFSTACLDRGAAGLFYATTTWATSDKMSAEEYRTLACPYDLKLLGALPPAEFNILHVCQRHNFLHLLKDYPVHAFNWDAREAGNPSLAEGSRMVGGKTVIGGLGHDQDLLKATPQQLSGEVLGLRAGMGKKGWMLGTGCTFRPETPENSLLAIREAVGKELDARGAQE
jgi:uroporphyrinogen decarboxylase